MLGGHIGRLLSFRGSGSEQPRRSALFSDGLRVDATMFCRNGFTAQGEVRLPGARIGGRLYFDGAKLSNPGGRALVASRLTVGQDMYCRAARGGREHEQPFVADGVVDLPGAHIGGHLECDGAQLRNDSGPALYADSLQVDQDMLMRSGFTATGAAKMARSACPAPASAATSTARGDPAQRLRPRPVRRPPASRSGHVSPRRVHRHRQRRRRRDRPGRRPHRRPPRLHRGEPCATTPAPPWTPTACRSARACTSFGGFTATGSSVSWRGQPDRCPHRRQAPV